MRRIRDWIVRSRRSSVRARRRGAAHSGAEPFIALIHFADRPSAVAGETVSFLAWILNDSSETLTDVALVRRSFTNAHLQTLSYSTEPDIYELNIASLPPGESADFSFTYVVSAQDIAYGGEIVSAMQVRATSTSGTLWDECDAIVQMGSSPDRNSHPRVPWETSHMPRTAQHLAEE